ncbi:MAG: polyribonucleotide nucleotidyltransferase [Cyclobacteriaceae bacterium]|nr:polyribonucleotide nucleotidyltransferase [Cyclobacteriaceae bacterium]
MRPEIFEKTIILNGGRQISIQTGLLARQADGSALIRMGNTMLLATVVSNKESKEGVDFMPLSVDYQEKFASSGRIPGGFLKREGRLSDHEVLISRFVDRALRPLFPEDYHAETQVSILLISADDKVLPDGLAALAASSALAVSDIPFGGPISEVRIIRVNGEFIINPSKEQVSEADIDLLVGATLDNITMVEGEMKEVSEKEMVDAILHAHEAIKEQCRAQLELGKMVNKTEKREYSHEENDEDLRSEIHKLFYDKFFQIAGSEIAAKAERKEKFDAVVEEYIEGLPEEHEINLDLVKKYTHEVEKQAVRDMMLKEQKRLDGRKFDEIRPIWCEVDYLPSTHGSALFTRGETQALTTVTLGTKLDEQTIDGAIHAGHSKFFLHYNFPAFSTGEVKPNRGPGRREIGHGNLALRALRSVIPGQEENPYTIRIVSDILESNGSSSMATVCAGSMALMDSGVKIKSAVSGIAMGLIKDNESERYAILSDILGDEDHLGDMDFKVTGTTKGITACQMDIKIEGLSYELLTEALEQAKKGRTHILNEMNKAIAEPRADYKPTAPRYSTIMIPREMIGMVIGPGGKVIQEIQSTTETTIVVEEIKEGGKVSVFALDKDKMEEAVSWIKKIVAVPEVGKVYEGIVKSVMPFGAFIEFMPGKEGLLHISEIKWERIESMEGVLEIGEEVSVKLIEVDRKTGKFRLSRKILLPKPEKKPVNK